MNKLYTPAEILQVLPTKPGVYRMWDKNNKLLYVGKAKHLKNRVSSYFRQSGHSPRIALMVSQIDHVDYIVTETELEALLLEANLIKNLRPKYNILLRDDKKYPWLMFTAEPYPRLVITREPDGNKKARYFGPYASPSSMYETLRVIKKIFPLRQRRTPLFKDRPCMNFHIGNCLGPCQKLVSKQDYQRMVEQVELFLNGHADDLLIMVQHQMEEASENLQFELAAQLRDRYKAIENVIQHQRVMSEDPDVSQDVVGMAWDETTAYIAMLKVRRGKLIQTQFFDLTMQAEVLPEEAYQSFLVQYYQDKEQAEDFPKTLILQCEIEDKPLLQQWLGQQGAVEIRVVQDEAQDSFGILEMARKNALESKHRSDVGRENRLKSDPAQALLMLEEVLDLPQTPRRIECYDISHVQGTNTVASMVVFTDGVPDKKEYRRFKIQTVEEGKPDDFQSMREVMTRRFTKREEKGWPDPDLIIIDGGKGQLSSAVHALRELGITEQPIISLAKKFEEVFLPGESKPVVIERDSMALFLLQRIRDEAHRFAITYHRNLRGKAQTKSVLDSIRGIGEARKQRLLEHFPSISALQEASLEEIAQVTQTRGKTAETIYEAIRSQIQ